MSQQSKQNFLLCKLAILLGFAILSSAQVSAQTNNINVNFTGEIVASNCRVVGGAAAVTVPLGQLNVSDAMSIAVQTAIPSTTRDISVKLAGCPPGITVQLSGQATPTFNRLKVAEGTGAARGFAIAPRFNNTFVGPNSAHSLNAVADGSIDFSIGGSLLRTVTSASEITPGSITASMTLTFTPR